MEKTEIKIIWTEKSISDLNTIFQFLFKKSESAAYKTIELIYKSVSVLDKGFTKAGRKEPLLNHLTREYRYLISGKYKIIYRQTENKVFINTIFDMRQNPNKLKTKR